MGQENVRESKEEASPELCQSGVYQRGVNGKTEGYSELCLQVPGINPSGRE